MNRANQIESLLRNEFDVSVIEVLNESHQHSVPENSETHFKLTLVSSDFEGKSKVLRHQSVYRLMNELMQQGLHALALHLYTPQEWEEANRLSPDSPQCMGGSKR